jgi:transcriptional regulator with XRE-family HTH domain
VPKSDQTETRKRASVKRTNSVDRHVGARMRALRKAHALSQAELGTVLGVSPGQVQKYECGRDRIGAGSLFDAARVFGVKVSVFFEEL